MDQALQEAARLDELGVAYALVTVLSTKPPTSASVGARAVIMPDGGIVGFVGGECTRTVMVDVVQEALADGRPRRILLSPDAEPAALEPGTIVRRMTCHSGGTVELFLEPHQAPVKLIVIGDSPVALRIQTLAGGLPWRCERLAPDVMGDFKRLEAKIQEAVEPGTFVVVATMGQFDDWAVDILADLPVAYVGVVASRRRGDLLHQRWVGKVATESGIFRAPAGLDLGSRHPGEIALSILAEMAGMRENRNMVGSPIPADPPLVIDPVCGMHVDLNKTPYQVERDGIIRGFCGAACQEAYLADPERYQSA